ncbi:MAG: DNA double-strand break repair nuclease NurA [archaeon]
MNYNELISDAVSKINFSESNKKNLALNLAKLKGKKFPELTENKFSENQLSFPVKKIPLTSVVAGIDSGFVAKSFHSSDLLLVKAMASIFSYDNGKLSKAQYYPNYYSFPKPVFTVDAMEAEELSCKRSLVRLEEELSLALSVLKKFKPDYLLLDGSIIPQYVDKSRHKKIEGHYSSLIDLIQELYQSSIDLNCCLVGCVEDSRGARFSNIIQENLSSHLPFDSSKLDNVFDSVLLNYFLNVGERTMVFSYSKSVKEHPVLSDLKKEFSENIQVFYLKPSPFDRPLRIEFLNSSKCNLESLASTIQFLSSFHKEYAYPTVLIEADLRARLNPTEVNNIYHKVLDKLSKNAGLLLRRNSRPF